MSIVYKFENAQPKTYTSVQAARSVKIKQTILFMGTNFTNSSFFRENSQSFIDTLNIEDSKLHIFRINNKMFYSLKSEYLTHFVIPFDGYATFYSTTFFYATFSISKTTNAE